MEDWKGVWRRLVGLRSKVGRHRTSSNDEERTGEDRSDIFLQITKPANKNHHVLNASNEL